MFLEHSKKARGPEFKSQWDHFHSGPKNLLSNFSDWETEKFLLCKFLEALLEYPEFKSQWDHFHSGPKNLSHKFS